MCQHYGIIPKLQDYFIGLFVCIFCQLLNFPHKLFNDSFRPVEE